MLLAVVKERRRTPVGNGSVSEVAASRYLFLVRGLFLSVLKAIGNRVFRWGVGFVCEFDEEIVS